MQAGADRQFCFDFEEAVLLRKASRTDNGAVEECALAIKRGPDVERAVGDVVVLRRVVGLVVDVGRPMRGIEAAAGIEFVTEGEDVLRGVLACRCYGAAG